EDRVKIIIIDDGSVDGTSDWIRINYPSVDLLSGDGSLWWSGGINLGTKYAIDQLGIEYILWWNNDIKPEEDYLSELFRIIENNDESVIIGSKIYVQKKNTIWGMGGKFNPVSGKFGMYGEGEMDNNALKKQIIVDWLPGMGTIIHRSVFENIGYTDNKTFPQYYGDSDFTYRAKMAGFILIVFPELIIYNDISNTGMLHHNSLNSLIESFIGIKSKYNIRINFMYYRRHSKSILAYFYLIGKYYRYIGGFFKWNILGFFGINKNN
ncbi:glycosyltransferase family 2 protein, partial [Bacteroidota bacterium]